jgi:hypothetical protein
MRLFSSLDRPALSRTAIVALLAALVSITVLGCVASLPG